MVSVLRTHSAIDHSTHATYRRIYKGMSTAHKSLGPLCFSGHGRPRYDAGRGVFVTPVHNVKWMAVLTKSYLYPSELLKPHSSQLHGIQLSCSIKYGNGSMGIRSTRKTAQSARGKGVVATPRNVLVINKLHGRLY